ncbi:MAG TPA: transketolase [Candidatus Eisenbacteria bacterium]|nr:transketolase [Candidatus Eisenbacteria bacterium]
MTPATIPDAALDRQAINTIRFLAADAVEKANSGHPGMPMGMADVAYALWTRHLRYQPHDPAWPGRDRFVLSAGHGSMLLYAMLHLAGYDLPLAEIERFRQLGSRTPGHPEHGVTPGVETTTGPLGQGIGNAVGMALAAKLGAARFASGGFSPTDFRVFSIAGDGCLMEGVSHEAASLAGHLGLDNLVLIYDDNHITIEGDTALAMSDDAGARFAAYGWNVLRANPYEPGELLPALERAVAPNGRPTLLICRSHIGYGAPKKQDTRQAHGEPLGAAELAGAKRALGWPESPAFLVPDEVRARFARRAAELKPDHDAWHARLAAWRRAEPARAALWDQFQATRLPADLFAQLVAAAPTGANATRSHAHAVLQRAAALVPMLVGGSADLEPSTKTSIQDSPSVERGAFAGRNLHFGIREHGMSAVCNGLALSGWIPYGASFLTFTDYARPAIRLSALMGLGCIWVYTHDSIFLGEDGPTHQAVEHLAALRAIPNLMVIRPADGPETAAAWALALERRRGPTLLALSRQTTPALERPPGFAPEALRRGGYVLREHADPGAITLIATGSEVGPAVDAAARLAAAGRPARVVSMMAPQLFLAQDAAWRDRVLPPGGRRVSIEAGVTDYWWRFLGGDAALGGPGLAIGVDRFGESAPAPALAAHFGLTAEAIARRIEEWAARA